MHVGDIRDNPLFLTNASYLEMIFYEFNLKNHQQTKLNSETGKL